MSDQTVGGGSTPSPSPPPAKKLCYATEDPGFVIQFASADNIHRILGGPGLQTLPRSGTEPVPTPATIAQDSFSAFCKFTDEVALEGGCQGDPLLGMSIG
jgi:hypothetical protein